MVDNPVTIASVIDRAARLKNIEENRRRVEKLDLYHGGYGIDTEEVVFVSIPADKLTGQQVVGLTHDEVATLARMVDKRLRIEKVVLENWFKDRGITP